MDRFVFSDLVQIVDDQEAGLHSRLRRNLLLLRSKERFWAAGSVAEFGKDKFFACDRKLFRRACNDKIII